MTPLAIDPALTELWTYWCVRRGTRPVPSFDDIDLAALGPAAERVLVVRREGGRFRYGAVGSSIRTIYGYPMENLYLDIALPPDRREAAIRRYTLACDSGRPILTRNGYQVSKDFGFCVDRLILPLAGSEGVIAGVICGQVMRTALDGASLGAQTIAASADDQLVFLEIPAQAAS